MLTPVKWYQIGQIKIWTKQKKTDFVKDGTKFDTYDQCLDHCKKYGAVFCSPIRRPDDTKCNYYCTTYWDDVKRDPNMKLPRHRRKPWDPHGLLPNSKEAVISSNEGVYNELKYFFGPRRPVKSTKPQ